MVCVLTFYPVMQLETKAVRNVVSGKKLMFSSEVSGKCHKKKKKTIVSKVQVHQTCTCTRI